MDQKPKQTFQAAGKTWTVRITVGVAEDVRDQSGHDLLESIQDGSLALLAFEPEKLADVLWGCVGGQHEGVDAKAFRRALGEDEIFDGFSALKEALLFFVQRTRGVRIAQVVRSAIEKQLEVMDRAAEKMAKLLDKETPRIETAADARMDREMDREMEKLIEQLTSGD